MYIGVVFSAGDIGGALLAVQAIKFKYEIIHIPGLVAEPTNRHVHQCRQGIFSASLMDLLCSAHHRSIVHSSYPL